VNDISSLVNPAAIQSRASGSGQAKEKDSPEAVAKAASQFESLLITQLLQSARGSDGESWMGTDANEAGATLTEMSEQALSTALASKGGLGLAKLITTGLQKSVDQTIRTKHGE
jgi:Rod binding domain-containing protein